MLCYLRRCVNGITAITNSKGDRESLSNIPRLMLTLPSVVPSALNSVCPWCTSTVFWCCQLLPLVTLVPISVSAVPCRMLSYNQFTPYSVWRAFICSSLPSCQWATGPLYLVNLFCIAFVLLVARRFGCAVLRCWSVSSLKVVGKHAIDLKFSTSGACFCFIFHNQVGSA